MKVQSYKHRGQARTTESSGWILFPPNAPAQDSGPPVEYAEEETLMVRQLSRWWRKTQDKGKDDEIITNGAKGEMNGNTQSGAPHGGQKVRGKNMARRGGRKVNYNHS
jgi:hypothetical protein